MPFSSQAQRNLIWAAKNSAKLRKKIGMSAAAADKMTQHDEGGKLPKRVPPKSKALKKMLGGR